MFWLLTDALSVAGNEGRRMHHLYGVVRHLAGRISAAMRSLIPRRLSHAVAHTEYDMSSVPAEGHQSVHCQ